jgi:organic hydroperoxide reductase OsmC/OhrA
VSLLEDDEGGFRLAVELHATIPGIGKVETHEIMEKAHESCPYSKALRGDTFVTLVVD